jgi:TPR repeat protein
MGVAYQNGFGVEEDYAEAARWFETAAKNGHSAAQCSLGVMYTQGEGVEKDYAKARKWFEKGVAKNNLCSIKQMGFLYWSGHGVEENHERAFKLFKKAADRNDASGMRLVGYFYEKGLGVAQDHAVVEDWYKKAIAKGDSMAKDYLADMKTAPKVSSPSSGRVSNLPAGAVQYVSMIRSSDGRSQQRGAKSLYKSPYKSDPKVLKVVEKELLKGYNRDIRNGDHVDAMSWLCNILGTSGDRSYAATLQKVYNESGSKKIKKYARKNYGRLR